MSSNLDSLFALRQKHEQGTATRDALWAQVREANASLVQYRELLAHSVAERIEIRPDGVRLCLRSGLSVAWDPADIRSPPNIVVTHGAYEPFDGAMLETLARGAKVVLDIGANMGWYSLHIANANPRCTVHAFEPVPSTFATLRTNVALNRFEDRIRCHAFGFGERAERVTFYIPTLEGSPAASQRPLFADQTNTEVSCDIVRLDDWAKQVALPPVDLIKIDVEGGELSALRGAIDVLGRDTPAIFCEMLRKWSARFGYHPNDIIALVRPLGYECWGLHDRKLERTEAVTDATAATNFLFLHATRHAGRAQELMRLEAVR